MYMIDVKIYGHVIFVVTCFDATILQNSTYKHGNSSNKLKKSSLQTQRKR